MKNSELRKIARMSMKGKISKASLYVALYTFFLGLLNTTPAGPVLGIPLSFGIIKLILNVQKSEKTNAFDFFNHGIDNFGKVWCTYILIVLKALIPTLLAIVSFSFCGILEGEEINNILLIIGLIFTIVSMCIFLKYSLINYEILYNPGLNVIEIIKKHENIIKGNTCRIIRMNLYYTIIKLFIICLIPALSILSIMTIVDSFNEYEMAFIGIFLIIIIIGVMGILFAIASILITSVIEPRLIVSNNELYNYLIYKNEKKTNGHFGITSGSDEIKK